MNTLDHYLDDQLSRGRTYFSREEALKAHGATAEAFTAAATRLIKKHRLVIPWRGFYLILRPEDRIAGATDPVRWIDPLMKHLKLDYRISLLRAAAFHGASHQAAMVFQVIVPKQLRGFEIGRHRLQFTFQTPDSFAATNQEEFLQQLKSETGFAKVAGAELMLLDCARYFHKAGGITALAQIVYDTGTKADPHKLRQAAVHYENSAVRRLGYLLEYFGNRRQSRALELFALEAKSMKPLDPSVKPLLSKMAESGEKNRKWMLTINESVEVER